MRVAEDGFHTKNTIPSFAAPAEQLRMTCLVGPGLIAGPVPLGFLWALVSATEARKSVEVVIQLAGPREWDAPISYFRRRNALFTFPQSLQTSPPSSNSRLSAQNDVTTRRTGEKQDARCKMQDARCKVQGARYKCDTNHPAPFLVLCFQVVCTLYRPAILCPRRGFSQ